jgi:hypothetical protein
MAGPKTKFAAVLRERGVLDGLTPLVAVWPGRLIRVSGADITFSPDVRSAAVLGVSRRHGFLLSSAGLITFELSDLKGAHSERYGHLGFDVVPADGRRIAIDLRTDMSHAVATQLNEMRVAANTAGPEAQQVRRPQPKRRGSVTRQ